MINFIINKAFLFKFIVLWLVDGLNECYISSKIYNPKNKYNPLK